MHVCVHVLGKPANCEQHAAKLQEQLLAVLMVMPWQQQPHQFGLQAWLALLQSQAHYVRPSAYGLVGHQQL
jgi:hypothetical protein